MPRASDDPGSCSAASVARGLCHPLGPEEACCLAVSHLDTVVAESQLCLLVVEKEKVQGGPRPGARSLLTYTPDQGLTLTLPAGSRRAHPAPSVCEGRGRPGAGGHPGSPGSLGRLYWASSRATCRKPAILPARGRGGGCQPRARAGRWRRNMAVTTGTRNPGRAPGPGV